MLLLRMMNENRAEDRLSRVAGTVRGVVCGILGIAALSGVLYAIGFEVVKVTQKSILAKLDMSPSGLREQRRSMSRFFLLAKGRVLAAVLLFILFCGGPLPLFVPG
jgi:hypothetical protein